MWWCCQWCHCGGDFSRLTPLTTHRRRRQLQVGGHRSDGLFVHHQQRSSFLFSSIHPSFQLSIHPFNYPFILSFIHPQLPTPHTPSHPTDNSNNRGEEDHRHGDHTDLEAEPDVHFEPVVKLPEVRGVSWDHLIIIIIIIIVIIIIVIIIIIIIIVIIIIVIVIVINDSWWSCGQERRMRRCCSRRWPPCIAGATAPSGRRGAWEI